MKNPAEKQHADTNIALRGPTRSSHLPNTAADSPRNTNAMLKIQTVVVSGQSPGTGCVMPISRFIGRLNTDSA